jgi:Domain of unknown function (DUF4158)
MSIMDSGSGTPKPSCNRAGRRQERRRRTPRHRKDTAIRHARAGFEHIPQNLSRAELFRYFTFPEPDRREIAQCRGESNKIGFALLLGDIRLTRVSLPCRKNVTLSHTKLSP